MANDTNNIPGRTAGSSHGPKVIRSVAKTIAYLTKDSDKKSPPKK